MHLIHRTVLAGTAVLLLGTLTACSTASGTTGTRPTSTPAPTASVAGDEGDLVQLPTAQQTKALTDTAERALTAYLDRDNPNWFDSLAADLTDTARTAYGTVNIARIPAAEITGEPIPGPGVNDVRRDVRIPTTAGTYRIDLVRAATSKPWRVDLIAPLGDN